MTKNETLNNIFIIELDDFPDYFISENGDIYSDKFGKMKKLKPAKDKDGYFKLTLHKNGKQYTKTVHRLLAETFIANPNNLKQVDHKNNIRDDNRLENLRWVTCQDNNRNQSISKANISEYQGVCFHKKDNLWRAQWYDNYKQYSKSFSVKKYGEEEAKQLAIDYRKKMVDELYDRPKFLS